MNDEDHNVLVSVKVLLRSLPNENNVIAGLCGVMECCSGSSDDDFSSLPGKRFRSWWTHFSLLLEYDNGELYRLERDDESNVVYQKVSKVEEVAGKAAIPTIVWTGWKNRRDVEEFVVRQREGCGFDDIFRKNCRYFAYDFFRSCLADERATDRQFEHFTELCQNHFRHELEG